MVALGVCVNARHINLTQRLSIKILPTSLSVHSSVPRYSYVCSVVTATGLNMDVKFGVGAIVPLWK